MQMHAMKITFERHHFSEQHNGVCAEFFLHGVYPPPQIHFEKDPHAFTHRA